MAFDLAEKRKLAALEETGIAVAIDDESGKPVLQDDGVSPITISVVGSLSKRYRKYLAAQRGRALNTARSAKVQDDETLGEESLTAQTAAVAACVTGWSSGFTDGGAPLPFSLENAVALLTASPFVQSKLERAMDDHARFFGLSSTGSPK